MPRHVEVQTTGHVSEIRDTSEVKEVMYLRSERGLVSKVKEAMYTLLEDHLSEVREDIFLKIEMSCI